MIYRMKSDRSHVVLWAKELIIWFVFLRTSGLRPGKKKGPREDKRKDFITKVKSDRSHVVL